MNLEDVIGDINVAPPQPEFGVAELFAVDEAIQQAIREENEALEFLCYLALRDGRGVFVERWRGSIRDARVSPYVPSGQMYIVELDRLGGW